MERILLTSKWLPNPAPCIRCRTSYWLFGTFYCIFIHAFDCGTVPGCYPPNCTSIVGKRLPVTLPRTWGTGWPSTKIPNIPRYMVDNVGEGTSLELRVLDWKGGVRLDSLPRRVSSVSFIIQLHFHAYLHFRHFFSHFWFFSRHPRS